ncbi:low temperature requirement protein A [Paraconexibacter antarcticus]|uniref:Low temperature requirement protein A n=1 Tax=Paraconexibacter antarcticus TaxID=2949664 RepID=A0ABY5DYT2_9ACTN|nr:low temperature requirement protein A [Paraconexibacter antarcticus]UTI66346.1 low temperature requirement protein A [Paraconexibacter antarcticus]
MSTPGHRAAQVTTTFRSEDASVKSLELFFDLVVVLALTQCTALMAKEPTWQGLAKGLLILGVVWWAWVGYAWLTSVIDPEEGLVRIAMFTAMAALLLVALCIPRAFDEDGLLFAVGYAFVRGMHIVLFVLASREDPALRRSVTGLAVSTAIGVGLIFAASATDGTLQDALWAAALVLDAGGPFFFGTEGWQLVPGHFAERHSGMIIIALGESIVAIGVGADGLEIDAGVVLASVLGMAVVASLWWLYFDIVALVAERRLHHAAPGRERNAIARDSFSYLHFPMIAGIVLIALGLKKTLSHVGDDLGLVPVTALLGGGAVYLLAHVAFRLRNVGRFSSHRVVAAAVLVAFVPAGHRIPAAATVGFVAAVLIGLIVYEAVRFSELRSRLRRDLARH